MKPTPTLICHRKTMLPALLILLNSIPGTANFPASMTVLPETVMALSPDEVTAKRPTDIKLIPGDINENQPAGTTVGTLSTVDPDAGNTHTYTLVSKWYRPYPDNAHFSISGNQLVTKTVFDYEVKSSYKILIRSTDNDGLYYEKEFTVTIINLNEPPVATNVRITRSNNRIGTTNTGTFTYTDPDKDAAGTHLYKWYRLMKAGDTLWIDSVSAVSYVPVLADGGYSIGFEVTPRDSKGLAGIPVKSSFLYINAAPVAGEVHIYAPEVETGSRISGRFSYSDLENNAAGKHTYRWYRSSTQSGTGTLIAGATDSTYAITSADDGRFVRFEIIPSASAGSTPGAGVSSDWTGPLGIPTPRAVLSGVDTTCPGDTAILTVALEGTPPFSITYLRNGTGAVTISGITDYSYLLKVVGDGIYTLSAVSDFYRKGRVSGSGTVIYRDYPTATMEGNNTICEHITTDLRVTLTGHGPWSFSYRRGTEIPTTFIDVTASPKLVSVSQAGTYTLTGVSDQYCHGTVSGNAVVTVIPAPDVTLSGLKPAYSDKVLMVPVFGQPKNGTFTPALMYMNDTNYFLPAIVGPGIHTIIYSYRDAGTGCYGYDTATVAVLSANADITFPENDTKRLFCYNEPPFIIVGYNKANSIGTFYISGGVGLTDNRNNTATIDPSQLNGGRYKITYYYRDLQTDLFITDSFDVEAIGELRIYGLDEPYYCDNDEPVRLIGNAEEGIFSGKAVTGNQSSGFYFEPRRSGPGYDSVFYTYTTRSGCSRQIYKPLIIRDAADISFTILDSCISADKSDSIQFINLTKTTDPVLSWLWEFDDASGNNTSGLKNPKHRYNQDGRRQVTLTATTGYCRNERTISLLFGDDPKADFRWATECFHEGRKILFYNILSHTSPDLNISEYQWEMADGEITDSADTENAEHLYSKPGNYRVNLFVRSTHGCSDTVSKTLILRPTYELSKGDSYFEGFENGPAGWASMADTTVNSWTLGMPGNEFRSSREVTQAWFTRFTKPDKEQSAVTSPCFDFSGITKPMIKLDISRQFDQYRNGAVLQYTADSGKSWPNLGKIDDGINWYNNYEISGKPGGQDIGWSGRKDVLPDNDWVEARHSVDQLQGKTDVQFRIAYGCDVTAANTYGLAFDNFSIGERSKIVLVEHFTNAGDTVSRNADSELDAVANSNPADVIDIQYHTSFPGADPFNEQNKVDPATRVLFYQLSDVPYSIINGGVYRVDYFNNKKLDVNKVITQSLLDPKFSINLNTSMADNGLTVNAEIRSLEWIADRQVTLHLAVVERKVTGITGANGDTLFESVLRSMLSSTSYSHSWDPSAASETVTRDWNFKHAYNADEIRVIAFIQDEATHEIYQAMIDKFDAATAIGSVNDLYRHNGGKGFTVFPNPSVDEVYLRFDRAGAKTIWINLYDISGKLVVQKELQPHDQLYSFPVKGFEKGLYFLRICSDHQFIGIEKLVIAGD